MAILLVKIEDEKSLAFNEFFDYRGYCYASTRSRSHISGKAIDMADFYEAAVNTEHLPDIPVVFVQVNEDRATILGWYKKAEIFSEMHSPSLFLEGNIKASVSDCLWLPKEEADFTVNWFAKNKTYEVVEEEDTRFRPLQQWMEAYRGGNQLIRYHSAVPHIIPKALQDLNHCKAACGQWAQLVTSGECRDIRDLKTLEVYARALSEKEPRNPDGYYYLALADYHLGLVKEGLKQINKALKLEEDASDLIALKGMLLISKGYVEEGARHLHEAWVSSGYETYLIMEGRAYMMTGQADKAYDCFKQIEDEKILEESGIRLKDMEKKWNYFKYGYMRLRDILKKKNQ